METVQRIGKYEVKLEFSTDLKSVTILAIRRQGNKRWMKESDGKRWQHAMDEVLPSIRGVQPQVSMGYHVRE